MKRMYLILVCFISINIVFALGCSNDSEPSIDVQKLAAELQAEFFIVVGNDVIPFVYHSSDVQRDIMFNAHWHYHYTMKDLEWYRSSVTDSLNRIEPDKYKYSISITGTTLFPFNSANSTYNTYFELRDKGEQRSMSFGGKNGINNQLLWINFETDSLKLQNGFTAHFNANPIPSPISEKIILNIRKAKKVIQFGSEDWKWRKREKNILLYTPAEANIKYICIGNAGLMSFLKTHGKFLKTKSIPFIYELDDNQNLADYITKANSDSTRLIAATQKSDLKTISRLLPKILDAQNSGTVINAALISAVDRGDNEIVKLLFDKKINKSTVDEDLNSALVMAVENGFAEIVELLLENGADIKAKDMAGNNTVLLAVKGGYLDVLTILLRKGADVNDIDQYGQSALILASEEGDMEIIDLLSNATGVIIDAPTRARLELSKLGIPFTDEDFIHNIYRNNISVVELFISAGININTRGYMGSVIAPALSIAIYKGHIDIIKLLLQKGADIYARTSIGHTPLSLAKHYTKFYHRDGEIAKLLKKHGAKY